MATTTATTKKPSTNTGACGTMLGHSRHRAASETPCRPCLDAANLRRAENREAAHAEPPAALPLPSIFGRYAGTAVMHEMWPADASQCAACWGWRDDVRHPVAQPSARRWEVFRR